MKVLEEEKASISAKCEELRLKLAEHETSGVSQSTQTTAGGVEVKEESEDMEESGEAGGTAQSSTVTSEETNR